MNNFKYNKICKDFLSGLNKRQRAIVSRRFALGQKEKETLESIGNDFDICRERVRQIEGEAINKVKENAKNRKDLFLFFYNYLERFGGFRKEEILLKNLSDKNQNEVYFLLSLAEKIKRKKENDNFYALWTINVENIKKTKESIQIIIKRLKEKEELTSFEELKEIVPEEENLKSAIEISKRIQKNEKGLYGLSEWPEINPKGVQDKAYLALKGQGKPLHFTEVAGLIEGSNVQTVHNELIKNDQFILVGRGTYALSEWGYHPGKVKDVIARTLEEEGPLSREEILEKVLEKRKVKKNTVLLNLGDKEKFIKKSGGEYDIKSA